MCKGVSIARQDVSFPFVLPDTYLQVLLSMHDRLEVRVLLDAHQTHTGLAEVLFDCQSDGCR